MAVIGGVEVAKLETHVDQQACLIQILRASDPYLTKLGQL